MNTVQLAYDRPPPLLPHLPPDYWLNYMLRPSPLLFSSFLMLSHSHTAAYEQYMILLPWRTSHIHKHSARILGLQPRQRLRAVGVSCHRALLPPPRVHPALYPRKRRAVLPGRAGHLRDITSLKILRNPTKCPTRKPDPCGHLLDSGARRSPSPATGAVFPRRATITTFNYRRRPLLQVQNRGRHALVTGLVVGHLYVCTFTNHARLYSRRSSVTHVMPAAPATAPALSQAATERRCDCRSYFRRTVE